MLQTLHIENYALIQQTDITFDSGFVVITGETGAGKSIMLGALGLLLGQRADTQVLSDKERKCVVEATFDISGLGLAPLFEQYDAEYDDVLILRREILPSSKSRAFVNDTPANLQFLKELGPHILDIHSQYQTLTLTSSHFQTELLDSFSTTRLLEQYQSAYARYTSLKRQLEALTTQDAQNNQVLDYNRFLLEELQSAQLQADEQADLEEEAQLLEHTGTIKDALALVLSICDGDGNSDDSAVSRLVAARGALSHITSYHNAVESMYQRIDSTLIELQDIMSDVSSLDDKLHFSPERHAYVTERLDLMYRLQKKHNVDSVSALIEVRDRLEAQVQDAESLDDRIREVMEQVDKAYAELQHQAEVLTQSRHDAAAVLQQSIMPILAQLGMSAARVVVEVSPAADYGPMGHDNVCLLFNANQGGSLRPLAEVASGGELSRLMLAVKSIVTRRNLLPTIIFDEIDSGVSGDISVAVGEIMRAMAQHMQVVAISHLPQLAAKANQHLKVAKALESDRTISRIRQLDPTERITEIAVMLSSNPPTPSALQTARELMS